MPSVDLFEDSPANKVNLADLCANKKVILFAVPGAFTPGCSKVRLVLFFVRVKILIELISRLTCLATLKKLMSSGKVALLMLFAFPSTIRLSCQHGVKLTTLAAKSVC